MKIENLRAQIRYTHFVINVKPYYDECGWFRGFTDGEHFYRAADLVFQSEDDFEVSCR